MNWRDVFRQFDSASVSYVNCGKSRT